MAINISGDILESDTTLNNESLFLSTDCEAGGVTVSSGAQLLTLTAPTITNANGDVLLANTMPQARYMYGCAPTATAMLLGYYDLYGYRGNDFSNLFDGNVDLESRGSEAVKYTMNDFDSVLGSATASLDYVSRFFSKDSIEVISTHYYTPTSPEDELEYSFVNGGEGPELRTDNWNCLADYLGTGQVWRGNENLGTTSFYRMLEQTLADNSTQTYVDYDIPAQRTIEKRYMDLQYGLYLYVQDKGYSLDMKVTGTHQIDVDGGSFTFEDYAKEIDAGRPVMVLIDGHIMTGYGYNAATREIIFDDCYEADQRMVWDGVYHYSGNDCGLNAILTVGLMAAGYDVDLAVSPYDEGSGITDKLIIATAENQLVSADYCFRNSPLYLNFAVSNLGANAASDAFDAMIYIDNVLADTVSLLSLAPGTITQKSNVSLSSDLGVGFHTVSVRIDPDNEIQETSGTNNFAERSIMVLKEDATVVEETTKGVYSGQVSNDDYVYGSTLVVLEGGTAVGTVIQGKIYSVSSEGIITYAPSLAVVYSGGQLQDAAVYQYAQLQMSGTAENISVYDNATALFNDGSVVSGISVFGNGLINVKTGGTITGRIQLSENAQFVVEGGAVLDFDLSKTTAGADALVNNLSLIYGLSLFSLTVTGTEANGLYSLAEGAAAFNNTITVKDTNNTTLGTLSVGDVISKGIKSYTLGLSGDTLTLTVDGTILFDISTLSPGNSPLYDGSELIADADYELLVSGTQTNGTYSLANNVSTFSNTITVKDTNDATLGTITVGEVLLAGGKSYKLDLSGSALSLTVGALSPTAAAASADVTSITISSGSYTGSTAVLYGKEATIIGDADGSTMMRSVIGGIMANAPAGDDEHPVSQDINLSIKGGTFSHMVAGGNNIQMSSSSKQYFVAGSTQQFTVTDGLFKAAVSGADRFVKGYLERKGDVVMNISGGTFTDSLAGGFANAPDNSVAGTAYLTGDIAMNITGGTFTSTSWIYGGCLSSKKIRNLSTLAKIDGNITITVDSSVGATAEKPIVLTTIVAGSQGWGTVSGDTKLVFKGSGDAIQFNESKGDLWGASSGDNVNSTTGKTENNESSVDGRRILSFTGFNGTLNCTSIRAFSHIEFKGNSSVVLNNDKFNLNGFENWEIESGSSLTGNFTNDFAGDTLNLTGFSGLTADDGPQLLLTDSNNADAKNVFNGFDSLSTIQWNGAAVSSKSFADNAWTFSANSTNYRLELATSGTETCMTLSRLA